MKNPAPYLRKKIGDLIDTNVTYDDGEGFNDVVPVVASEGMDSKYQIFIGDYSDADRSNAHVFGSNASQLIEIVGEQDTAQKKHVDAIGELVMNIIHPTTQSNLLSGTDFMISVVGRPSINHLVENSGDGTKIVRLFLRYNLLIYHN